MPTRRDFTSSTGFTFASAVFTTESPSEPTFFSMMSTAP